MRNRSTCFPLVVLFAACVGGALLAQAPGQPPPVSPQQPLASQGAPSAGLKDRTELETFFDGVIAAQKEANHIVGVTIAVVANGELFFAKGYGYADRAAGKKVDPERTMFRVGSVSKLFTWTAVMQQVEAGKIDLKADVNQYLAGSPVHVPETYRQPIRMIDLMTHTAGFEDHVIGLFARSPAAMRPLGDELAATLPARVRPPGQLSSYSNHGTALAGYIVERVSGVPYEQYIEQRILQPLEMMHTAVRQPVPKSLAGDMAVGYRFASGEQKPEIFEYVPASPAGAISASAVDMSHFMLAHLQDGRYRNGRILSEATARQMHTSVFGHVPALNGMMHGFYEMNRNGHRIYGHGGDTFWFHTQLALLPDDQVGIFVSYNNDSGSAPRSAIVKAFIDRYFPDSASPTPPAGARRAGTARPAGTFAGSYRAIRMSYTSLAKLAALIGGVTVSELPAGRLLTSGLGENPRRWTETDRLTFRDPETGDRIAFLEDSAGHVTHLVADFPAIAFERLGPWETPGRHIAAIAVSLFLLVFAIVALPVVAWRGRHDRPPNAPPRWGRLVLWLDAVLLVGFVVALAAVLVDPQEIAFGVPASLKVALALPIAAALCTAAAIVFLVQAWIRPYWRAGARLYYALVVAAAVVFLIVLNYWNLLGWRFR